MNQKEWQISNAHVTRASSVRIKSVVEGVVQENYSRYGEFELGRGVFPVSKDTQWLDTIGHDWKTILINGLMLNSDDSCER